MLRNIRFATFATLLAVLAAGSASAGVRIEGAGGLVPASSDATVPTLDGQTVDLDADFGGSYAVGAAWVLDDRIELGGQWQQSFLSGEESTIFPGRDDGLDLSSATFGARYQLFDRESLVRPFVVGQVGVAVADASSVDDPLFGPSERIVSADETGFGLNAGGGVDFQITRYLSVGADLRYNYAGVFEDVHYMTTMLNVGLHFG